MLRGISRVIQPTEIVPGRYYLTIAYGSDPVLFQCVHAGLREDGKPQLMAVYFSLEGESKLTYEAPPQYEPVVEMPEVHIRVDPPAVSGSSQTMHLRPQTFFVAGEEAYVIAPTGFRGWLMLNLSVGAVAEKRPAEWLAFSRWSLVVDEDGQEVTIASFGLEDT